MTGPPVHGEPVISPVMLIGQAPGAKEIEARRPFAWTAGRTLFKWFEGIGLPEEQFRKRVYMAAVCRCFPGKRAAGGDRLPDRAEVANCSSWLDGELTDIEREVLRGLKEHEVLASNPEVKFESQRTFGQVLADRIAIFGGSWTFLILFGCVIVVWMLVNVYVPTARPFDPTPSSR